MNRTKKAPQPTHEDTRVLRLIALHGGMILTHVGTECGVEYTTTAGERILGSTAERLIAKGWLISSEGDSMFGAASQLYRTLEAPK